MSQTLPTYETLRFTAEDYHRLGEAGILDEDSRVELIEGELVVMSPISKQHAQVVRRLNRLFHQRVGDRCLVDCQNVLALSETSEPQPDLLLLDLQACAHDELPCPADVLLLVEVAHSSLGYDRGIKLGMYAKAGLPEVWILNLMEGVLECYRSPEGSRFAVSQTLRAAETVTALAFPGVSFAVAELMGG